MTTFELIEIGCVPGAWKYSYTFAGIRWLDTTFFVSRQSGHFCTGIYFLRLDQIDPMYRQRPGERVVDHDDLDFPSLSVLLDNLPFLRNLDVAIHINLRIIRIEFRIVEVRDLLLLFHLPSSGPSSFLSTPALRPFCLALILQF